MDEPMPLQEHLARMHPDADPTMLAPQARRSPYRPQQATLYVSSREFAPPQRRSTLSRRAPGFCLGACPSQAEYSKDRTFESAFVLPVRTIRKSSKQSTGGKAHSGPSSHTLRKIPRQESNRRKPARAKPRELRRREKSSGGRESSSRNGSRPTGAIYRQGDKERKNSGYAGTASPHWFRAGSSANSVPKSAGVTAGRALPPPGPGAMPARRSTNKTDPRIVAMDGTTAGGVGIGKTSGARMAKYDPSSSGEDRCCRCGPALH